MQIPWRTVLWSADGQRSSLRWFRFRAQGVGTGSLKDISWLCVRHTGKVAELALRGPTFAVLVTLPRR